MIMVVPIVAPASNEKLLREDVLQKTMDAFDQSFAPDTEKAKVLDFLEIEWDLWRLILSFNNFLPLPLTIDCLDDLPISILMTTL